MSMVLHFTALKCYKGQLVITIQINTHVKSTEVLGNIPNNYVTHNVNVAEDKNTYLKSSFVLSNLTWTSLLSSIQNSMKTASRLSYHLPVAACL